MHTAKSGDVRGYVDVVQSRGKRSGILCRKHSYSIASAIVVLVIVLSASWLTGQGTNAAEARQCEEGGLPLDQSVLTD